MKKRILKIFKKLTTAIKTLLVLFARFFVALPRVSKNIAQKTWYLVKNPKLISTSFLLAFHRMKKFFKKLPRSTREWFFLMVMSAENNVQRFHRIGIKNIPHIGEVREYQKYTRKKTFKIAVTSLATIVLVISVPIIFHNRFAQSKTYQWIQQSVANGGGGWVTLDTSALANATSNLANWSKYYSRSGGNAITADGNGVALTNIANTPAQEDGTTHSYSGALDNGGGMYPSSVAGGAYVANGSMLNLKKPAGVTCGSVSECASGICSTTCKSVFRGSCTQNSDCNTGLTCDIGNANTCIYSFAYSAGNLQNFTVPAGISSLTFRVAGAAGGTSPYKPGGNGGLVQKTISVTPGSTIYIGVGGKAIAGGAYGGGGGNSAYAGGGSSDVRTGGSALANRVIVGGGGGGAGSGDPSSGAGGCSDSNGSSRNSYATGGQSGTSSSGGAGGTSNGGTGSLGVGGSGGSGGAGNGGGGGGGYYGGGGGGIDVNGFYSGGGGGGGGSNWCSGGCTSTSTCSNSNAGYVIIQ